MASNAHRRCETCVGMGFIKLGDFANRSFKPCAACAGIGQIYLEQTAKAELEPAREHKPFQLTP